ncbi:ABC transporter substrate-binding protein [Streptomyces calidiresistens]
MFSNGDPVTAHDVEFTYTLLKEDGVQFDLGFVDRIRAIDDHTIEFTLTEPRSTFVSQLTEIPILPGDHYGEGYSADPIGSGPYRVVDYPDGQQLILERNPHWYGPTPGFDKLTFLFLTEDAALAAARAGDVDVLYVPPTFAGQKLPGMSLHRFESVDSRGLSLPTLPAGASGRINGKDVEVGNDVTADPAIRQALNLGLDRKAIVDIALQGYGRPAYSLADTLPWFNEETVFEDGDVEGARELLAEAGWVDENGDGIVEKDGLTASFTLLHPADDNLRSDLALVVGEQARELGIDIRIKGTSWDGIFVDGKANAVTWGGGRHHPHQLYEMYSTEEHNVGYNNMPHYSNEQVDRALEQALAATTQEEANSWWKRAQWDGTTGFAGPPGGGDAPLVWLARIDHLYFVADGVSLGEQPMHAHGHEWALFNNIADWRREQ